MPDFGEFGVGLLAELRQPDRRTISEWAADGNVILPHSKVARNFRLDTTPWLIEILDSIRENEFTGVCKCTQGGGTTAYEVFLTWLIANAPTDVSLACQTDPDAWRMLEEKILPTLKASPATAAALAAAGRNDITKDKIKLANMTFRVHGVSLNSLQSASLEVFLGDECWRYPLGTILEIIERTSTKEATRQLFFVSQAGEELVDKQGRAFWDEWGAHWHLGTQEVYNVRCPKCSKFFEIETNYVTCDESARDQVSKRWDWAKVESTAKLTTPCCGHVIRDTIANRRSLSNSGKYIQTNPNPKPRWRTFRFSAWVVYWQSWGGLLSQFLRAQDALRQGNIEPLKIFTQKKEARWWTVKDREVPSFQERKFFGYKMNLDGTMTDGAVRRLMEVDMQTCCWKAMVTDLFPGGKLRVVFAHDDVKSWEDLAQIAARYRVQPHHVGVDSKNWVQEVWRECAKRGWIALQGSDTPRFKHVLPNKETVDRFFSPARQGRIAVQTPKAGGGRPSGKPAAAWYYDWGNLPVKDWLSRLLSAGDMIEYPDDVPAEFIESLDSEARKTSKMGKPIWEQIGSRPNHFWDLLCMTLVHALIIDASGKQVPIFFEMLEAPEQDSAN